MLKRAFLIGLLVLAACARPDYSGSLWQPVEISSAEAVRETNAYRAAAGLDPIRSDRALNEIAEDYADILAAADTLTHTYGGSTMGSRLAAGGYRYLTVAENLGAGYSTPEEAFRAWYDSPGHRANLLNPSVTEIGIGSGYNPNSRLGNFFVLVLALPRP